MKKEITFALVHTSPTYERFYFDSFLKGNKISKNDILFKAGDYRIRIFIEYETMENGDKNNEYYDRNFDNNVIMAKTKTIDVKVYQNTFTDINAFYYLKKNNMLLRYIYSNVQGSMLEYFSRNILEAMEESTIIRYIKTLFGLPPLACILIGKHLHLPN